MMRIVRNVNVVNKYKYSFNLTYYDYNRNRWGYIGDCPLILVICQVESLLEECEYDVEAHSTIRECCKCASLTYHEWRLCALNFHGEERGLVICAGIV